MSCPLPPHQCRKYKCPTHPDDRIEGNATLCQRGTSCSNATCHFRHNFRLPGATGQNTPAPSPHGGSPQRPNKPVKDTKPGRGNNSPNRGVPKSKPGNQKNQKNHKNQTNRKDDQAKKKNGCKFAQGECRKWECLDHPRERDEFPRTDSRPCLNGPSCPRADCCYSHDPENRPSCPLNEEECAKYRCHTHPDNKPKATNQTACLSGPACYNKICGFDHDPGSKPSPTPSGGGKTKSTPRGSARPPSRGLPRSDVSSVLWNAFKAFHADQVANYDTQQDGDSYGVTPHSKEAQTFLRNFLKSVQSDSFTPDNKLKIVEHCQKLYPLKDGYYIIMLGGDVHVVSQCQAGAKSVENVVKDLKTRRASTCRIACAPDVITRLRGEVKPPQSYVDFFGLSHSIQLKVENNCIHLSGFVRPGLLKQNAEKVGTWIDNNSSKQEAIGPLAQHQSIWYKKCGSSQFKALAARKEVNVDWSAKKNTLFIRGQPEQVDEAKAEIESMLVNLKSIRCGRINHVPGLQTAHYLKEMNEVIGEDSDCCLFFHQDAVYLIGSSTNPQTAENAEEIRSLEFAVMTFQVQPKVADELKKFGFGLCKQLQDRFNILINISKNTLDVAGATIKIAELQRHIDSDMQVATERVNVPRMVNQYLRAGNRHTFVLDLVKSQGRDVRISGNARRISKDKKGHFYTLEGSRDDVAHVAKEVKRVFASMEAGVISQVIDLALYQDHIIDCHQPELNDLVNKLGVWQDRGQIGSGTGAGCMLYRRTTTGGPAIELFYGDIVQQHVDVLVNAANSDLNHSGGVAAAIEKKAQVQAACIHHKDTEGRVAPGSCWRGSAGKLKTVGSILHAVGPEWVPGCNMNATRAVLEQTMASIFHEANQCGARSLALPLISCSIFNQLGAANEANILQIIIDSVQKLLTEDTTLQVIRFVEVDKKRVTKFLAMIANAMGDTNDSLRNADKLIDQTDIVEEQPEFIFYWKDDDRTFKPYGLNMTDPAHLTLSQALRDGESSALLVIDNAKYANGMRYQITFGSNNTGKQYNDKTNFTREIKWEPNPDYRPPAPVKLAPVVTQEAPVTIPLTLSCVPQADLGGAVAGVMEFLRNHTFEHTVEHALLPGEEVLRNLCQKHHVGVDIDPRGSKCTLRGDRDAVNTTIRDIMQEMNVSQVSRPRGWTQVEGRVNLSPSDREYQSVATLFLATIPQATILRVERIQNTGLYQQYHAQLNFVRDQMGGLDPPCRLLFHGTSETSPEEILNNPNGFNRSYASQGMWGKGTYFAERSAYSHGYAYKVSGVRQMFLVDVIVGEHVELPSNPSLRDAPKKPDGVKFYHSVKGFTKHTNVYITYSDNRQYPRYLITYTV